MEKKLVKMGALASFGVILVVVCAQAVSAQPDLDIGRRL